jgi:hypothetical protein
MSLTQDIQRWTQDQERNLIKSYEEKGFRASGNWAEQLESNFNLSARNLSIKFLGAPYTFFMINGRGQ